MAAISFHGEGGDKSVDELVLISRSILPAFRSSHLHQS